MTEIDSYTKLMLHMDGAVDSTSFPDSSLTPKTVTTAGAAKVVAGGVFDQAGQFFVDEDYLSLESSADWNLTGADSFSINFRYKLNTGTLNDYYQGILGCMSVDGVGWAIEYNSDSNILWAYAYDINSVEVWSMGAPLALSRGEWHAFEISVSGTTGQIFLDGSPLDLSYMLVLEGPYTLSSEPLTIGALPTWGESAEGLLDEVMISKGVARHTSAYTVETDPYGSGEEPEDVPGAIVISGKVAHVGVLIPATGGTLAVDGLSEAGVLSSPNITYFGSASVPADNGYSGTYACTIVPPANMVAGDMVACLVQSNWTGGVELTNVTSGGQSWHAEEQSPSSGHAVRLFWCVFNGTWSQSPAFLANIDGALTGVMHVFRPGNSANNWGIHIAPVYEAFSVPDGNYDVIIPGCMTTGNNAVVLAGWFSRDDNSWQLQSQDWSCAGLSQYRNRESTHISASFAYRIRNLAGRSGSAVNRQVELGPDEGVTLLAVWREVAGSNISVEIPAAVLTTSGHVENVNHAAQVRLIEIVPALSTVSGVISGISTRLHPVGGVLIDAGYAGITSQAVPAVGSIAASGSAADIRQASIPITTIRRYRCIMSKPGLPDVAVPIQSLTARQRDEYPSYAEVVAPGFEHLTAIIDRLGGAFSLWMDLEDTFGSVIQSELLFSCSLDLLIASGSDVNQQIMVSGYRPEVANVYPQTIRIEGANYKAMYAGKLRIRKAEPDLYLRPGDLVLVDDDIFTAGLITYSLSSVFGNSMEVAEND
ncbi:MAG: LamG-like jellyroll fold domain-containing protein [Pseudomonadota bacterium]